MVFYPALPDYSSHDVWWRDFTGSASVFSVVFRRDGDAKRITHSVEGLRLFSLGSLWGRVHSLIMATHHCPACSGATKVVAGGSTLG